MGSYPIYPVFYKITQLAKKYYNSKFPSLAVFPHHPIYTSATIDGLRWGGLASWGASVRGPADCKYLWKA